MSPRIFRAPSGFTAKSAPEQVWQRVECPSCGATDDLPDGESVGVPCYRDSCDGTLIPAETCLRCSQTMREPGGPPEWVLASEEVEGVCPDCITEGEARAFWADDDRRED